MIPDPDVRIHTRTHEDELLIISSDGVWDGVDNDEAVQIAYKMLRPAATDGSKPDSERTAAQILSQGDDEDEQGMRRAAQEERCAKAADALLEAALSKGSTDNMVAIVVDLKPPVAAVTMVGKKLFE